MIRNILPIAILISVQSLLMADTTTVGFDSGGLLVYDQNVAQTNPLTGGSSGNGNGAVLQLGYYSTATVTNNFSGTWIPLSGEGSLNTAVIPGGPVVNPTSETYNQTSVGDFTFNGASDGSFAISLNFIAGSATAGNSLPASSNVPLALRFYNGTTIANSTFYNVVSDDLWLWKSPITPPSNVNITLADSGLEWLSVALGQNVNTDFHTTISLAAVPEPSTWATGILTMTALAAAAIRRRRA